MTALAPSARKTLDSTTKALLEAKLQRVDENRVSLMEEITDRWSHLIPSEIPSNTRWGAAQRAATAQMYENQLNWVSRQLHEETRTANIGAFQKYLFPVLRNVAPHMIAHELVSVQTIDSPSTMIFYLGLLLGSDKGSTVAGAEFPFGFNKHFSSEYQDGEPVGFGDGTNFGGAGAALSINLAYFPVRPFDSNRNWAVIIEEIDATTEEALQTAIDDGSGSFDFTPSGVNTAGTINYSNGAVHGFKFQTAPIAANPLKAYYYYDMELSSKIPQVQLEIKKAPVEVITRKLKAIWSIESMEDLKAMHGTDAEAEMVAQTSADILLEVDREILDDLFRASIASGITDSFDMTPLATVSEIEHIRGIVRKLSNVSNRIHQATFRAPANWMVASTYTGAILEQLTTHADYRPIWVTGGVQGAPMDMPRPQIQHGSFGVYKMGTLQSKWVVYIDPFAPKDFITLGLKGSSMLDSGYVFCPYVNLQVTDSMYDPDNFGLRKGFRMRYAKKVTRNTFYGNVRVTNAGF